MNKVPPQNLDAERSVLGSILIDANAISNVADSLRDEHFYSPVHQVIYESIIDLYKEGKPVDMVTLSSVLKKKKKFEQIGGAAYLSELIAEVPTSAHLKQYADIVRESSIRRQLISFSGKLGEIAHDEVKQLDEILNELEGNIFSLSQDNSQRDFVDAAALLQMLFDRTEEYSKNPNALRGIPTGLNSLDAMLGGLHKSDLIILAARPAVGKSSFAFDIARHIAVEEKKSVAIFSLEMPAIQIVERLMAQQINVSTWDLRMAKLTDAAYARLAEGAGKLSEAKLFVDDTPGVNIMQIRSKARKLKMEQGLDFIVIDYLQLMQGTSNRVDSRAAEVSEISRSLKILARELNVPIMALSQLNRSVESRNDHLPQLSDLRESGSIEQDADIVMFLNREKTYNPDTERPDAVDVLIAKHRNGPVGKLELRFEEKATKFLDL